MPLPGFVEATPRLRRGTRRAQCDHQSARMCAGPTRPLRSSRTVVVGGGPSGMCAAFMLAELGFDDVTVLERAVPESSRSRYGGYTFGVRERSQRMLRLLPGVMDRVKAAGSLSAKRNAVAVRKTGKRKMGLPSSPDAPVYVLRAELVRALRDALTERHPELQVQFGKRVVDVAPAAGGGAALTVVDEVAGGAEETLHADFVLACDGSRSAVRTAVEGRGDVLSSGGFGLSKMNSSSVGLGFRFIETTASPTVEVPGAPYAPMDSDSWYFVLGDESLPRRRQFKLVFVGTAKDNSLPRGATIVLQPDHDLWKVKDLDECYKIFEENFPHLRIRTLFSKEKMEAFLASKLGHFPAIQRSMSLVGHFGPATKSATESGGGAGGVALIGDSAHSFPPDLGQGVNSAFEDVHVLRQAIEDFADSGTINDVLEDYEKRRTEDITALMHLMKHGAPYQYGQTHWGLYKALPNMKIRQILSNIAPSYFSPCIARSSLTDIPYSEAWRNCERTTRHIWRLAVVLVLVPSLCVVFIRIMM